MPICAYVKGTELLDCAVVGISHVALNIALWVMAGFLAAIYATAGTNKLIRPYETLINDPRMGWSADFSPGTVKFVGLMESWPRSASSSRPWSTSQSS
jgi:hypothetical protein